MLIRLHFLCLVHWIDFLFLVIAKNIDAYVILPFQLAHIFQRCWKKDSFDIDLVLVWKIVCDTFRMRFSIMWMKVGQNTPDNAFFVFVVNVKYGSC